MSQGTHNVTDTDIFGRILSIEQRIRGLQGRVAAIETRLSGPGDVGGKPSVLPAPPEEEFVPAFAGIPGQHEEHEPASGQTLMPAAGDADHRRPGIRAIDGTGLIAGAILIGAGLLLYTGNLNLLRNPLLALGCGILLITGAVARIAI